MIDNKFLKIITLITLCPMASMGALAMDIYIPFVPLLEKDFLTSSDLVQHTLNVFMLAMAFGQIFFGVASDRFGSKLLIIFSAALFLAGSLLCAMSTDIYFMILARALQGVGACGGYCVSYAYVRENFNEKDASFLYCYLSGLTGLAPIFGPILGACLNHFFHNWRSCFWFLSFGTFLSILMVVIFLPNTQHKKAPSIFNRHEVFDIFFRDNFLRWFMVPSTVMSGLFLFFGISSHYIQTTLGYDIWVYSAIFGFNAILYTLSSLITPFYLSKGDEKRQIMFGLTVILASSVLILLHSYFSSQSLIFFLIPIFLCSFAYGLILGPATGLILNAFSANAGLASSLNGTLQFLIAFAVGSFFVKPPIHDGLSFGLPMLFLTLITFYMIFNADRLKRFKPRRQ